MPGGYSIPPRKARTSRLAGLVFLLLAVMVGLATVVGSIVPGASVSCDLPRPCRNTSDAVELLPETARAALSRDPAAHERYDAWIAQPGVRVGLAAVNVLEYGPEVFLLIAVGLGLRRLGERKQNGLVRALPWLKRASRAAIALAVVRVFASSLRSALLYGGMNDPGLLQFPLNISGMFLPLILAFAAYVTVWAMETGIRAERDLADFV